MVVKKKTLNNRSKLRSKNNNRTHKKKQLKKTKKQNRNRIQLGGGSDIDIYYKTGIIDKINANTIATNDPNYSAEVKDIQYTKLHELPEIKVKTNGKYILDFLCKPHTTLQEIQQSTQQSTPQQRTRPLTSQQLISQQLISQQSTETLYAKCEVTRSGTIFHTQKITPIPISIPKYTGIPANYIKDNFARDGRLIALTIIINIYKKEESKTTSGTKQTTTRLVDKQYFNLNPVK